MLPPRLTAMLAALGAMSALGGCKTHQHNLTGISTTTPTGSFQGTFAGGAVSGVVNVTFPTTASLPAAPRARFPIVATAEAGTVAAQATTVSGSLAITGDGTYTLSGTFDPMANPQLNLSGSGYAISGNYAASNGQLSGNFAAPGGVNGQWTASAGAVRVFCGTYAETMGGSSTGTWNLTLDTSNRLFGVATTSSGGDQLQGTYSPGGSPNVMVTFHHGSASGNLNPSTGAGSGTWSQTTGGSGTWSANTSGC